MPRTAAALIIGNEILTGKIREGNLHVLASDALDGDCWVAGVAEGHPVVIDAVYFDHVPIVCAVSGDLP